MTWPVNPVACLRLIRTPHAVRIRRREGGTPFALTAKLVMRDACLIPSRHRQMRVSPPPMKPAAIRNRRFRMVPFGTISAQMRPMTSDDSRDLGEIAGLSGTDPKQLGDQVFNALTRNDVGQFDGLIQALKPVLGHAGLEHLKQRMIALSAEPVRRPAAKERQIIGWGSGGEIYADDIVERARVSTVRLALQEIADAQGDVDAFVAQYHGFGYDQNMWRFVAPPSKRIFCMCAQRSRCTVRAGCIFRGCRGDDLGSAPCGHALPRPVTAPWPDGPPPGTSTLWRAGFRIG